MNRRLLRSLQRLLQACRALLGVALGSIDRALAWVSAREPEADDLNRVIDDVPPPGNVVHLPRHRSPR